jgi:hypothetical protein
MFDDEKQPGEDELDEIKPEEIEDLDVPAHDAEQVAGGLHTVSGNAQCIDYRPLFEV